ncbi:MAG: phosphoglycerate kinase [Candidatus Bathyarchaeia archaeon]
MGRYLRIEDLDLRDKAVFLRVDINSPIDPKTGRILDDTRIKSVKETLDALSGSRVVIGAHQGRPGDEDFTSLRAHAELMERAIGRRVEFIEDIFGPLARGAIGGMRAGDIILLENLRFASEEILDAPPEALAKTHLVRNLAPLLDAYVNDAFATAHRASASIVGFPEVLPSAAGKLMEAELRALEAITESPRRPCVFVIGGAKVEDKVPVVKNALERGYADRVLVGGLVAKVFLKAAGLELGKGEEAALSKRGALVGMAREVIGKWGDRIAMPRDVAVKRDGGREEAPVQRMREFDSSMDIGAATIEEYSSIISGAGTIVANGPMGVFEEGSFALGTRAILEAIANSKAFKVIGGGHLAVLAQELGISDKFSHISTGGGALLKLLSGGSLPAIEALERAAERYRHKA